MSINKWKQKTDWINYTPVITYNDTMSMILTDLTYFKSPRNFSFKNDS